jgi:ABC-type lipoprotein export system ATPase subunit
VVVAGEELGSLGSAARARFRAQRIGFVFQTFHLLPYLTVLENAALAGTAQKPAAVRQQARQLLERFHLGHRMDHRPAELSTGECQRVAIARAMINRPCLVLADEPTGNLDPENSAIVLEMLADFHREGGTVLLVTHQQGAIQFAQRTITLRNGSLDNH